MRGGAWCCRTLILPVPALAVPPAFKLLYCVGSCPILPLLQQPEHPEPRSALVVLVPCAQGPPLGDHAVHLPRSCHRGNAVTFPGVGLTQVYWVQIPLLKHNHLEQVAQDQIQMAWGGLKNGSFSERDLGILVTTS